MTKEVTLCGEERIEEKKESPAKRRMRNLGRKSRRSGSFLVRLSELTRNRKKPSPNNHRRGGETRRGTIGSTRGWFIFQTFKKPRGYLVGPRCRGRQTRLFCYHQSRRRTLGVVPPVAWPLAQSAAVVRFHGCPPNAPNGPSKSHLSVFLLRFRSGSPPAPSKIAYLMLPTFGVMVADGR